MLPSSNARLYVKPPSVSKSMLKFYKKPKQVPVIDHVDDPISYPISPTKNNDIKNKIIKRKRNEEYNEENEEVNYIVDKDDMKNMDFLFREATGYEIGDNSDNSDDSDDISDRYGNDNNGEVEKREKREKHVKHPKILYPFSHKSSPHFSHDYEDEDNYYTTNILVEFLIYRVNKYAYKPFLEFMLYKSDNTFYLPNLMCNANSYKKYDSHIDDDIEIENTNIYEKVVSTLNTIFVDGNYKVKGRLIPSKYMNIVDETYLDERYILFIEYILDDTIEDTEGNVSTQYIPEKNKLWWVTISEIFNYKKVLFYPIHDSIINIFYSYPEVMNIFMTGKLVEIPVVTYNGNNDKYTKYNAIFSLKKSSQFSRYGPFYYFTDFESCFKYACYDIENNMQKFERGGLLRTILFPQKIKMFLERDKIDDSTMAQYLFDKYPEKINTGQFRDNDNKWVKNYNTAYNGEYMVRYDRDDLLENDDTNDDTTKNKSNIRKTHFPVIFCIGEYRQQQVLSYHYVDTTNIPDIYSYEFKDYKLL
jgi:hypothetical protein